MSWYHFIKMSKALDPGAWEYESNPSRLQQHQDVVRTPYGGVVQPQDKSQLQQGYEGVHFTQSPELAAIYANHKATRDDPPVIIEVYSGDLSKVPDIDVGMDYALEEYVKEQSDEWMGMLEGKDPEDAAHDIMRSIENDQDYYGEDYTEDPMDMVAQDAMMSAPAVVHDYLESLPEEKVVPAIIGLAEEGVPIELIMRRINQFRVMHPVGSVRVVGVYKVPFVSLEGTYNPYNLQQMDDEELEDAGITKVDEYIFLDENGRQILDYEDLDGGWLEMEKIYENKQLMLFKEQTEETAFHGTSLERAKNAFPELHLG